MIPFERQLDARHSWQLTGDRCDRGLQGGCSAIPLLYMKKAKNSAATGVARQEVPKLKTTPTPNKNGSYGIKGGVRMPSKSEFVCHKSRFVHHTLCGSPFISRDFLRHTTAHFMAYYGVIFFANMGGGGGQNYFHRRSPHTTMSPAKQDGSNPKYDFSVICKVEIKTAAHQ